MTAQAAVLRSAARAFVVAAFEALTMAFGDLSTRAGDHMPIVALSPSDGS